MESIIQRGEAEENSTARCLCDYRLAKDRYLAICRRYGLNPFDLDIMSSQLHRLPRRDKKEVVRLIIRLVRLERSFRNEIEERLLFPLTAAQSDRTGYLVPMPVMARS